MKKLMIISTLLLLMSTALVAQNRGMVFQDGTLKEILAEAAKEKKLVFVDVYATWCGPCKMLAADVFPQAKVGEYMNKTFVNAKFDAEKGEGRDVASKYGVRSYPTLLILNTKGDEVGRLVGASNDVDMFIKRVQDAVSKVK